MNIAPVLVTMLITVVKWIEICLCSYVVIVAFGVHCGCCTTFSLYVEKTTHIYTYLGYVETLDQ